VCVCVCMQFFTMQLWADEISQLSCFVHLSPPPFSFVGRVRFYPTGQVEWEFTEGFTVSTGNNAVVNWKESSFETGSICCGCGGGTFDIDRLPYEEDGAWFLEMRGFKLKKEESLPTGSNEMIES
jgi:hypothetical protein